MLDHIQDECGVFGIYKNDDTIDIVEETYLALYALQHRGQVGAGIAVNNNGNMKYLKDFGMIPEALPEKELTRLGSGQIAMGHVKYSGGDSVDRANLSPLVMRYIKGQLSLAMNGALINYAELRAKLNEGAAIFQSNGDIEMIAYMIARARLKTASIEDAVIMAVQKIVGAFAMVIMSPSKLIGVRDPKGIRPLCYGKIGENYVITSESCVFDSLGGEFIRDVEPGEMLVIDNEGVHSYRYAEKKETALCVFEYIYFARPDSTIDGVCVNMARQHAGRLLAKEHPVEADLVCGVPDCAIEAAIGYSAESGIPLVTGLVKNKYIGRAFNNRKRNEEYLLRIKLNALRANVEGKRVIIIDDSILRGYTSKHIVELLRKAGAKEVHMRISSPPFKNPCYFLSDTNGRETLISARYTTEELCQAIGADSLGFLSLDGVKEIAKDCKLNVCDACFSGNYCIDIPENISVMRTDKYAKKIEE